MDHLSADIIDLSDVPYPAELRSINITMRGTRKLFDIFFSITDIETSFGITIPSNIDFTWINTPSGKDKYISYPTCKHLLFQIRRQKPLVDKYMEWIDSLLFDNTKIAPFFKTRTNSSSEIEPTTRLTNHERNSLDDTKSSDSYDSTIDIRQFERKIIELEHELALCKKDLDIKDRDIEILKKENEILQMRIDYQSNFVGESAQPEAHWI